MPTEFDLETHYPLDPQQIRFYRENGYLKLKRVFAPEALAYYRQEIARTVEQSITHTVAMQKRSVYDQAFTQVMNLWTRNETIRQLATSRRLARAASELMGCRGVRMYHDQALYKEPGGGFTPWHVDQHYWPFNSDRTVTAWIPLQETPLEMGPLAFAPGSFRLTQGRELEISGESETRLQRSLRSYPMDEAPFELGEVSFHSGWTFHRAGPNTTDRPREVMTVIYVDQDMRLAEPANANQANDRERWCPGVRVGDVLGSHLNPLLYSADGTS